MHSVRVLAYLELCHYMTEVSEHFLFLFISLLSAWGLCCFMLAFSSCSEWGQLFMDVCGLLTVLASRVAEHRPQGTWVSVAVMPGFSCPAACEIFPDQELNPCPLHWEADSQPRDHQRSDHSLKRPDSKYPKLCGIQAFHGIFFSVFFCFFFQNNFLKVV